MTVGGGGGGRRQSSRSHRQSMETRGDASEREGEESRRMQRWKSATGAERRSAAMEEDEGAWGKEPKSCRGLLPHQTSGRSMQLVFFFFLNF